METRIGIIALALLYSMTSFAQSDQIADEFDVLETEQSAPEMSAEEAEYMKWATDVWDSLDRKTGEVRIPAAGATFNVPEKFYYLNADDAEKVLVEVWGNPPGQRVLGMLFPSEMTPFDQESWAVSIEYEEDGYVSDEDADEIDYDDLLAEMKEGTQAASKERVRQGYGSIELVGWAAQPYYDATSNKMYWAKELAFSGQDENTLNYNIRVLGRKGVLVLNFIAGINQKKVIEENLDAVLALAEFDQGSRYADFDPSVDKVAAYGLGALVAGKVLAKTGLLAAAFIFLKKFGVFIFIGIAAFLRRVFSKKDA